MSNKVKLNLVGLDDNAFVLMAAFTQAARRQKFPRDYIDSVIEEYMSSDHRLATLIEHIEPEEDEE